VLLEISSRQSPDEFYVAFQKIEALKAVQTGPADLSVNAILGLPNELWNGEKEQAHATAARILVFIKRKLDTDCRNDLQLLA
jgi:hypothetical protein